MSRPGMDRRSFLAALAFAMLGCRPSRSGVTVGSKNFTEQLVLGELLAQYLESLHQAPIDRRFGLEVMPPLGFDNSFAMVMRGDEARSMNVSRLSQLSPHASRLRMGVG